MKKIFSLLSIIMLCFILVGCGKDKENQTVKTYHLFGKTYNNLKEINPIDVKKYANLASLIYVEKTYENFTENDIAVYLAYKYLINNNGSTANEDEIKNFVKNFFGINNYYLQPGTYINTNKYLDYHKEIVIEKNENIYSSNLFIRDFQYPSNIFDSIEYKENVIIVNYIFGVASYTSDEIQKTIGHTEIHFKYKNGTLILDRIIYTKI